MQLIWDDGSDSPVRNWCSDQPKIDNPYSEDPIPKQCVMVTSSGCWVTQKCNRDTPILRNYICDFDRRGSKNKKPEFLTLVNVLRNEINRIKGSCQSCAKRH